MRLLHIVHQYPPEKLGGTELYTQSLAEELTCRGHSVTVFTRSFTDGGDRLPDAAGAVAVVRAAGGTTAPARRFLAGFSDRECSRAFERTLDQARPELVHVQHLMGLPMSLPALLGRRGIPFVVSLHDYWWFCPNAQLLRNQDGSPCAGPSAAGCARCAGARLGGGPARAAALAVAPLMAWRRSRLARLAAAAALAIAPSQFVLDSYARHGFAFANGVVLPHGIRPPAVRPPIDDEPRPLRLLFIGGISPQKGLHVLVEALRRLGLTAGVELDVVGGAAPGCDAYLSELKWTAAGLPVRFLGQLPHDEAAAALAQAHVLAMPSVWPESFGLVLSEAFAAGRPVLASRIGALPERVRHGVDGLLVEPGDAECWREAIATLMNDRALLARLRAGVRPPLSLAEHAAAVEAAYLQAVASR
ncbi:MAG: glycosyltransferase family 4 protein [Anaerolineae bacterium]